MTTELWDQFVATDDEQYPSPAAFETKRFGRWVVKCHPSVRTHPVYHYGIENGDPVGFVLGRVLGPDGLLPEGEALRLSGGAAETLDERVTDFLDSLRGRFLFLAHAPTGDFVYLDSGGTLSAVFRTDRTVLASTTTLANYDRLDEFEAERRAAGPIPANRFFPAGLTGASNTGRLLPNHRLDLAQRSQQRYWPVRPFRTISSRRDMVKTANEIVAHVRRQLTDAARVGQIHVGLTAGRDSRVLTASARPVIGRTEFHTFDYKDPEKVADVRASIEVAEVLGLQHRVLPLNEPTEALKDDYCFRTGYDANPGKACDFYDAWMRHLPRDGVMVNGYGGEVGRGFYYKAAIPEARPDAAKLLAAMKLAPESPALEAMAAWLDGLPAFLSPALCYDLAYWELRAGAWALPQMYGAAPARLYFAPIVHRYVLSRMLMFAEPMRRNQYLPKLIVEQAWPRAASIPFNGKGRQAEGWPRRAKRVGRRALDRVQMCLPFLPWP